MNGNVVDPLIITKILPRYLAMKFWKMSLQTKSKLTYRPVNAFRMLKLFTSIWWHESLELSLGYAYSAHCGRGDFLSHINPHRRPETIGCRNYWFPYQDSSRWMASTTNTTILKNVWLSAWEVTYCTFQWSFTNSVFPKHCSARTVVIFCRLYEWLALCRLF